MRHWIGASAWRVVVLMCGVLVLSGAAKAARDATSITVPGTQQTNPVIAGGSTQYGATAAGSVNVVFGGGGGTCVSTLSAVGLPAGATASFSPATLSASASGTLNSLMTISTTGATVAGTYTFQARATDTTGGGCNSNTSVTSGNVTLVVQAATVTTTTTVASATNPSVTGQSVTFTATVTRTSGTNTPSGTVAIKDGATTVCTTGALAGGGASPTASCAVSTLTAAASPHSITAVYGGDTNFTGSTSSALSQVVNKANTTTTISNAAALATASNAGVAYPVNYSVAVTAPGAGTPTGTVTVSDGTGATCTGTPAAGTCSLTSVTAGAKTITATYGGDTAFNTSASSGVAHTVNVATTTTGLVSSANPSVVGQSVTFTATVAPIPTTGDTVTFKDGAATLGTGTTNASGVATLATSALTIAGNPHSITAVFAGDASYSTSTSSAVTQTVNPAATTTTITTNLTTATVVGQAYSVAFTVAVTAPGSGTVTGSDIVTVSDGSQTCTATVTAGTCSLTSTTAGAKTITAAFPGEANFNASTSAGTAHTVNKAATSTTINTDLSAATVVGQPYTVAFTVAVTAPGAGTIPGTDTVNVTDGTATCSATITVGSCSLTSTTAGAKTITASLVTDANFAASSSTGTPHTVSKASTTTTITTDLSTATNTGQAYTVAFTVAVTAPGAGTPTGTVTVSDGTNSCSATLPTASCSLTSLTAGAKTIVATYAGDTNFLTSASAGTPHTVNVGNSTTTLVSGTNPSVTGQSVTFTATVAPIPTTGSVITFKNGATTLGTGNTNASGVATLAIALDAALSPYSVTASFPGDANFNASTSNTITQNVNKAATTTTVATGTLGTATVVGQAYPVAFTVAVTAPGGGTITGSDIITVSDGSATCTATITVGTCNLTSTSVGAPKNITAVFPGDASYTTSTSTAKTHTVNKAATTTAITTNLATPTNVGQAYTVAFTVTATAPGSGTPTGTVTVSDGTATCGPATLSAGAGSCLLTSTTAGTKTITAVYAGDANYTTSTSPGVSHEVDAAPVITSANNTTFKVLTAGTFTVTATGTPAPTFSETGALPSGVTLAANGTLSGTPASGTVGTYPIVITATNGVAPDATQSFTLTVGQAPAITSVNNSTFIAGTPGSFQVTATGFPAPTFAVTAGTLPSGLTMTTAGLISGTAAGGQTQVITITASNGVTPNATQSFTVQVNEAPFINNTTTSVSYAVGAPASFQFALLFGTPSTATWTETGALPAGLTLSTSGLLSGTPTQVGVFAIIVQADNGVPPAATENFTITVGKGGTYTQPFNTGHGWIYTQTACSVGFFGSCSNNAADTTATDCNPSPCVLSKTVAGLNTGSQTGYFHNTYTWAQLGVPSQATIVSVDGSFWDKSSGCTGSTAGMQIFDSTNSIEITSAPLEGPFSGDADGSGATHGNAGSKTVAAAYQSGNTGITLRFNLDPAASFAGTCTLTGDNFNLVISYIPLNQHQVIVASVILDRFGRVVGSIPLIPDAKSKRVKLATE